MRTDYDGPTLVTEFTFSGRSVRLLRPSEPDRLLNDPDVLSLNRRDDYMPYWAYLWPGAFLLAEAVAREPWHRGVKALEIGCGLGLAGFSALRAGLDHVTFSDYDETPLQFVAHSARENGIDASRYALRRLDWRQLPFERFPVILGADVLYEKRLVPLVTNLLAHLLEPAGVAWIAGPYRVASEDDLGPCLERDGLVAEAVTMTSHDERGHPVSGTLHRVRHACVRHITVK